MNITFTYRLSGLIMVFLTFISLNNYAQDLPTSCTLRVNLGEDMSLCQGDFINLNAVVSGNSGEVTFVWAHDLTHNKAIISISPAETTTYYLAVTDSNNCTAFDTLIVTVNALPSQPFSVHFYGCGSTKPKAHAENYGFNRTYKWYHTPDRTGDTIANHLFIDDNVTTGYTSSVDDNVFNYGTTVLNTTFYVFEKDTNGCFSPVREVPITVFPIPQTTPEIISPSSDKLLHSNGIYNAFICGNHVTLAANGHGNIIEWRTSFRSDIGQTLATGAQFMVNNSMGFYATEISEFTVEASTFRCYGAATDSINIKFSTPPPAPKDVADISLCVGDAPKPLFTNPNYRWYTLAENYPHFPPDVLTTDEPLSKTYFIGQIENFCPSVERTEMHVTVSAKPSTPSVKTVIQPTCNVSTGTIELNPQADVTYSFDNGATYSPDFLKNGLTFGIYKIKVKNANGCTSATLEVVLNVAQKPAKAIVTVAQPSCSNQGSITITNLPAGGFSKIEGQPWILGKTVYNNLAAGDYEVKIKLNDCISAKEVTLTTPTSTFDPNKCYKIVNKNSGKVLDVFENKTANNTPIIQYALTGGSNQKWQFTSLTNGFLKIKAQNSNKFLSCNDNNNGTNVFQFDYIAGGQKDWKIECLGNGDYRLLHKYSGKYLSVENNSKLDKAKIEIRNWNNNEAQKWQIVEIPCANAASLRQADLFSAKAHVEPQRVNITWYSNLGDKTDYYTIEKFDVQEAQFKDLKTLNNVHFNSEVRSFTVYDALPTEGDNVYRIKAVFNDGKQQLSETLKVVFGDIKTVRLYPNPTTDFIDIQLPEMPKGEVILVLYNLLGKPVAEKKYEASQSLHFDIGDLPNGVYQLYISRKGKRSMVQQVIKQK